VPTFGPGPTNKSLPPVIDISKITVDYSATSSNSTSNKSPTITNSPNISNISSSSQKVNQATAKSTYTPTPGQAIQTSQPVVPTLPLTSSSINAQPKTPTANNQSPNQNSQTQVTDSQNKNSNVQIQSNATSQSSQNNPQNNIVESKIQPSSPAYPQDNNSGNILVPNQSNSATLIIAKQPSPSNINQVYIAPIAPVPTP
jgi:hypothetical protein